LTQAFINALLKGDNRIIMRLPKHWSKDPKGALVILLRALYGLKSSPRAWLDCLREFLEPQGWCMSPEEPGLFRKGNLALSIYVGDGRMTGPDPVILKKIPGREIKPVMDGDAEVRDILGAKVRYNRNTRTLDVLVDDAIDRIQKKFCMHDCSPVAEPGHPTLNPHEGGTGGVKFDCRKCVGGLLYLSVVCGPDVAFAVQRFARCVANPTQNAVKCAKHILAYLKGTKDLGLHYSPKNWSNFKKTFPEVAENSGKELKNLSVFTDSDFAGCTVTLKPISGVIAYYCGMPIHWSAKRQTIRSHSKCESECIAIFDGLRLTESHGFLGPMLDDDGP
jgi:hypothetical protein